MGYRVQAGSINASRAVYALNWFNVAPGLSYISHDLKLQLVQLGIITTAFYIGLSTFQMIGGLLASRIGNRYTSVLGISILGSAVVLTGLSQNLPELFTFRFLAGIGSAFFFSPALGLLADIVPRERYSFYVGLFNGSFNLGGGMGIIGWNILDQFFGWRPPLFFAGAVMLFLAVENLYVLRAYKPDPANRVNIFRRAGDVLRMPIIWLLPVIALAGILTETIIGQLFVYYAESQLQMSANLASSLGTLYLMVGFFGGALGGYIFGVVRRRILLFLGSTILLALFTTALAFVHQFYLLVGLMGILGVLTVNSLSMLYTLVVERTPDRGMVSFSLSFVNFIQNIIGAFSPAIFTLIAFYRGYVDSWLFIGVLGLLCASAGFYMRSEMRGRPKVSEINV